MRRVHLGPEVLGQQVGRAIQGIMAVRDADRFASQSQPFSLQAFMWAIDRKL